MKAMNLTAGDDEMLGARDPLKLICNSIAKWKDDLVTPRDAPAAAEVHIAEANRDGFPVDAHGLRSAAHIYAEYQRILQDANAADFGDLLLWPVRAMTHNPAYRDRWASRFDRVLTDEYQDVNRAQFMWLRYLCSHHHEIFAVGDDDQSIFGWRGTDITYIRRFGRYSSPARGEFPEHRQHPSRCQRRHRTRPKPAGKDPLHTQGGRYANRNRPLQQRRSRGGRDHKRDRAPARRRRLVGGLRGPLPQQQSQPPV
jgi:hypothetical protein